MKRQGDNIVNQPAVKKSDVNVSSDLRSKIGAKLQTLLNGFTPDTNLFRRKRRQLYEDLFGESQHSEIIIDPTIVIKTEAPDIEEISNDTTTISAQNFLISAKSRITELLNKKQDGANKFSFKDNGKENTVSNKECAPTSSFSSNTYPAQNRPQIGRNKKRKFACNRDDSSALTNNQMRIKNLAVVVEDIMNSKDRTKYNNLLPTENMCSSSEESRSILPNTEQNLNLVAKDLAINEISDSSSDMVECIIGDNSSIIANQSSTNICNFNKNIPRFTASNPKSPQIAKISRAKTLKSNPNLIPNVIPLGDILLEESKNEFFNNADDSELVDDPSTSQANVHIASTSFGNENNHGGNNEPEVQLLCVKRPTHEVITLEDDADDSDDIIEEIHECTQCGKAFRAKSLLNFHIRMHGSDLSASPSSSSQS